MGGRERMKHEAAAMHVLGMMASVRRRKLSIFAIFTDTQILRTGSIAADPSKTRDVFPSPRTLQKQDWLPSYLSASRCILTG
jgi:hypothetical protein